MRAQRARKLKENALLDKALEAEELKVLKASLDASSFAVGALAAVSVATRG